jgi:hypothetical protein
MNDATRDLMRNACREFIANQNGGNAIDDRDALCRCVQYLAQVAHPPNHFTPSQIQVFAGTDEVGKEICSPKMYLNLIAGDIQRIHRRKATAMSEICSPPPLAPASSSSTDDDKDEDEDDAFKYGDLLFVLI